jgi:hypothetical protein
MAPSQVPSAVSVPIPSPNPTIQPWAWWNPTLGSPTFQPFRDSGIYTSYPTYASAGSNDDASNGGGGNDGNKDDLSNGTTSHFNDWLDSNCSNHDIMLVALLSSACTVFITIVMFVCCSKLFPSPNRNLYASSTGGGYERVGYDDLDTRAYEMPRRSRRF